jgi:type VI secretion system protein ImpL
MIAAAILTALFLALLWAVVFLLKLPAWIAILVSALALAAWAGAIAWRAWRAKKAAGDIEKALGAQAAAQADSVRPDQVAEIEAMQAEFRKAVAALKGSKLARGGKDALAVLPWYMIVGPPGSGKSTALRASGLKFPYLTQRGGVRGVGGTRNCEWWLTNDAVLLDTAGRYATEDEDRDEWLAFLDSLKRTRPRRPANGLLVAVSIADVGAEAEEQAAELGKLMRERVDEVLSHLGMVLPIYVLFTKCDLLPGFVETFADLRKAERGQVWGFTLPLGEAGEKGEVFREHFDELMESLEDRALWRMGDERLLDARERVHAFPQQLEAVKGNLAAFVETLCTENVYQDTPILRGVYFTSGTQEGRTIDRVMASMAEAFGVRPQVSAPEPVVEAKSYFLRDVFAKVLFPDQDVAVRSAKAVKSERLRTAVIAGAGALAFLVAMFFPVRSFLLNRELALGTGEVVSEVAAALKAQKGAPPIDKLEPLRVRLALLVAHREGGAPLSMRFGMYRGEELLPHVQRFYAQAVRRLVLDPVFKEDVEAMDAFLRRWEVAAGAPPAGDHARYYDKLKMHLLLTAPRANTEPRLGEAEGAFVGEQVAERWTRRWSAAATPAAAQHLSGGAALYVKLLATDGTLALPRYEDLVRRLRRVLARVPPAALAVEKLLVLADGRGMEIGVEAAFGGPIPSVKARSAVRGAFSRRGYDEVLKPRLDDPAGLLEPWVLALEQKDAEAVLLREVQRLRSVYFSRYIDEWRRFIDGMEIRPAGGRDAALTLLQDLTRGEPPPMGRFFRVVSHNTRIAGAMGRAGEGVVDRLRRSLGATPAGQALGAAAGRDDREERVVGPLEVEKAFASFTAFAVAPDQTAAAAAGGQAAPPPKNLPIDIYQEQLTFVRDALQTAIEGGDAAPLLGRVQGARTRVRSLIDSQEVGFRPQLERILWPPIEAASSTSLGVAAAGASQKWCAAVFGPYRRTLAHRYPWNRDGDDAALADVAAFFGASGLVWGFYNEALRAEVQRAGDGFQFARQLGGGSGYRGDLLTFLKKAQEVTTVLFPPNAPEPKVDFSVRIRPTPKVASIVLEVDGQRFEYFNGPEEWRKMAWPAQGRAPGALLRVRAANGREETLQQDGEWGLFRLLEAGQPRGEPGLRDFAMSFNFPSMGVQVVVDFRPARSESPFFGTGRGGGRPRLLAPFRSGFAVPASIGKSGPPCS